MVNLEINNSPVSIEKGKTVLDAAQKLGIEIPTMCHHHSCTPFTSCMVCVVKNESTGKLIPSCSIPAEEGMIINTDSADVMNSRRAAIELLLSEHGGDCEAPCTIGCPAGLDVPAMMRAILHNDEAGARDIVFDSIPFPSILGRICPAPCEGVCRRKPYDRAVGICSTKMVIGDQAVSTEWVPETATTKDERVAVIGGGIAGMSSAWYLRKMGYSVMLFEREKVLGGALNTIEETRLPKQILKLETDRLERMGVTLRLGCIVGEDISIGTLRQQFDAVVIAGGTESAAFLDAEPVSVEKGLIAVSTDGISTSEQNLFAIGNAVKKGKLSVRSLAQGRAAAEQIDTLFQTKAVDENRYIHRIPRMKKDQLEPFVDLQERRVMNSFRTDEHFSEDIQLEASLCLHCDCRKPNNCKLRQLSEEYSISTKELGVAGGIDFEIDRNYFGPFVYESSKCIRCGLCVRYSESQGMKTGFTFANRGYDVTVKIPFGRVPESHHEKIITTCVEICPTGALAFHEFHQAPQTSGEQ